MAGFASTIFQPLTASLADSAGWRTALTILTIGLGAITISIHAVVLPGQQESTPSPHITRPREAQDMARRNPTMVWLTVAFTLASAAMAATIVHLIAYLVDHGWTSFRAAVAAGVLGATQVAARVVFALFAAQVAVARLALGVLLVPVGGMVVLIVSDGGMIAWLAVTLLGIGQGTASLLRPLILSRRLAPSAYGRGAASSAAWSTIARAVAPLALAGAAAAGSHGYTIGLTICAVVGVAGAVIAHRTLVEPAPIRVPTFAD